MPRIEQRTIIAFGDGGYCITLPKGWVEFFGLKKGDKVEMITDGDITIRVPQPVLAISS